MSKRIIRVVAALSAVAAGIVVQSARATYPGDVGRLAFANNLGETGSELSSAGKSQGAESAEATPGLAAPGSNGGASKQLAFTVRAPALRDAPSRQASPIRARWLSPITNDSRPNEVDEHFAGKPMATIPATTIGYPDGTCWVYSNKSSWAVIKCAPSSPPDSQTSEGATTRIRAQARRLSPITNESWPNKVDKHFAGKPMATIPASTIGYPDGTCWLYSNMSSWAVIKCLGGINTG
jgi:hypothetical protein